MDKPEPDGLGNRKPDPILESLQRAEEEHQDVRTNRRWFWRFLLPFVLFLLLSMAYIVWQAGRTG